MNEELARLEAELEKVKGCGLEYLPEYGFSSKKEIMQTHVHVPDNQNTYRAC